MWEKIKGFYQRRRDLVWLVIAIIIVLTVVSNGQSPISLSQKSVGGFYATDMEESAVAPGVSIDMVRDSSYMPTPNYGSEPGQVAGQEEKIRKNASLNLEVEKANYNQTKNDIDGLIMKHEGFYIYKNESVSTYNQADYRTYSINIKFAKDNFDQIVDEFKALGEVRGFNVDATDLTTQYYDTLAYKESAEKVRDRVQALLGQTQNINDIISVESKLADLQRQIDNYQRQLTNLDRQTEYSQLTLMVAEKLGYTQSFTK